MKKRLKNISSVSGKKKGADIFFHRLSLSAKFRLKALKYGLSVSPDPDSDPEWQENSPCPKLIGKRFSEHTMAELSGLPQPFDQPQDRLRLTHFSDPL